MNRFNRDLLVLLKQELMTPEAQEQQLQRLHELLYEVERFSNVILSYEVLDMVRYKVVRNPVQLKRLMKQSEKPFIFYFNRN
jgi:hypothetical protein